MAINETEGQFDKFDDNGIVIDGPDLSYMAKSAPEGRRPDTTNKLNMQTYQHTPQKPSASDRFDQKEIPGLSRFAYMVISRPERKGQ